MTLDPRLGAHALCFELSDERSETRWERCRECVSPVRHEAALGCCGSRFPLLLGCCGHEAALGSNKWGQIVALICRGSVDHDDIDLRAHEIRRSPSPTECCSANVIGSSSWH
jgi:hypothetical protein